MNYIVSALSVLLGGSAGLLVGIAGPILLISAVKYLTGYDLGVQLSGFYAILTGPIGLLLGVRYGYSLSRIINNPEQGWNYFIQGPQGWIGLLFLLLGVVSIIGIPLFIHKI